MRSGADGDGGKHLGASRAAVCWALYQCLSQIRAIPKIRASPPLDRTRRSCCAAGYLSQSYRGRACSLDRLLLSGDIGAYRFKLPGGDNSVYPHAQLEVGATCLVRLARNSMRADYGKSHLIPQPYPPLFLAIW